MNVDRTRCQAKVGDEIKAKIQVDHTDNLRWVAAIFASLEEEENRPGAPEILLEWDQDDLYNALPESVSYSFPENVRQSTYELRGTISPETPPGTYRLRTLSFQSAAGFFIRLGKEQLGDTDLAFVVEVLEEQPENTRPTGFRFTYDE